MTQQEIDNVPVALTQRKAVNASGHLGSLYDCYQDRVVVTDLENDVSMDSFTSIQSTKCTSMQGKLDLNLDISQKLNVENDLKLSLILNATPATGVSTILNYMSLINERTRTVYYSWIDHEETISDETIKNLKLIDLRNPTVSATHVITGVTYGIDALVVLQLPSNYRFQVEFDLLLDKICRSLEANDDSLLKLTSEERNRLEDVNNATIFSNIADLTGITNFTKFLNRLQIMQNSDSSCPTNYTMKSLTVLFPDQVHDKFQFHLLPAELQNRLEQDVLYKRDVIENFKEAYQEIPKQFLTGYLEGRLHGVCVQLLNLIRRNELERRRLVKLISDYRRGQVDIADLYNGVRSEDRAQFRNDANEFITAINHLEAKVNLIYNLKCQKFLYYNLMDFNVDKNDNERTIKAKLMKTNNCYRMLLSNDTLNKDNPQQLAGLRQNLMEERKRNSELLLIYADASYCDLNLSQMTVLSPDQPMNIPKTKRKRSPKTSYPSRTIEHIGDDIINILLLGEVGVGKSTFINALANYLTFSSLRVAESSELPVVIPVPFNTTAESQSEKRVVQYGNSKNSLDQDLNTVGQSVTQRCKSYIFTLKNANKTKLRIIDTPGFGDIRGIEEDEKNMEHILQYINNLTHLNAICFLLKPNISRLNVFFRACLMQLFSLLDPTAQQNIIFCFTNARSTFYAPGDTARLVRTMLDSTSMNNISFEKANTFCFDNESFPYLVAIRNGGSFEEDEKKHYEISWTKSITEFNRLIDYVHKHRIPYNMRSCWQSLKHAQFEISNMIRPILETIRNILRNLILCKMSGSQISIGLYPEALSFPIAAACLSCRPRIKRVGLFWIAEDSPHKFQQTCTTCSCSPSRHDQMTYILKYRALVDSSNYTSEIFKNMLDRLCMASAELSYFLLHGTYSTKEDLFALGFVRMINEEKYVCGKQNPNDTNTELLQLLEKTQHKCKEFMRQVASNSTGKTLNMIYQQMNVVRSYPDVNKQMLAIEQGRKEIMKEYEIML